MGDQRRFITIQPFDECCDAAFIIKLDLFGVLMPRIRQKQAHAAVEKSKFAKAMFQLVEIELCDLEGGGGRQKRHHRSLPVRISHNLEWRFCIPVAVAHVMLLADRKSTRLNSSH